MSLFKNQDKVKNYVDRAGAVRNIIYGELTTGDVDYFIGRMYRKNGNELKSDTININDNKLCCVMNTKGACIKSNIKYVGSGRIGDVFSVTSENKTYVIKAVKFNNVLMKKRNIDKSDIKNICEFPDIKDYQYISCDEFTNEFMNGILISYLTEHMKLNFNPFIKYYGVYICGDSTKEDTVSSDITGYILEEYADYGNLEQLKDLNVNTVDGIMMQVIFGLDFLKRTQYFNHGDLKPANVLLMRKEMSGDYDGIHFKCPYTVKITDFDKSSITVNNKKGKIRIYNNSLFSNNFLTLSPFKQNIKLFGGKRYYKFSTISHHSKYSYIRHMGIPFYMSYDIYTFIISFMLVPGVYDIVMNNEVLKSSYWDTLWVENESKMRKLVSKEVEKKRVHISYNTTIDLINDVKLKCDLVGDIIKAIKESF